jgi:hypothetical protein
LIKLNRDEKGSEISKIEKLNCSNKDSRHRPDVVDDLYNPSPVGEVERKTVV